MIPRAFKQVWIGVPSWGCFLIPLMHSVLFRARRVQLGSRPGESMPGRSLSCISNPKEIKNKKSLTVHYRLFTKLDNPIEILVGLVGCHVLPRILGAKQRVNTLDAVHSENKPRQSSHIRVMPRESTFGPRLPRSLHCQVATLPARRL